MGLASDLRRVRGELREQLTVGERVFWWGMTILIVVPGEAPPSRAAERSSRRLSKPYTRISALANRYSLDRERTESGRAPTALRRS